MNDFIKFPQKTIAHLFGYKGLLKTVTRNVHIIQDNTTYKCKVCGKVHDTGYLDPINTLLQVKSNDTYSHVDILSPFLCAYCYYIQNNYVKKLQNPPIDNIADIIVFPNRYENKEFKSSALNNDLLQLFINPIQTPYYILLKEQLSSNTIVNMVHTIKVTLDSELLVINYGLKNFICPRQLTLNCLDEAIFLIDKFNTQEIKLTDDVLFNRSKSLLYDRWFTYKLRENKEFMLKYTQFINNYSEDIRFVAKIIFKTYQEFKKGNNVNF